MANDALIHVVDHTLRHYLLSLDFVAALNGLRSRLGSVHS